MSRIRNVVRAADQIAPRFLALVLLVSALPSLPAHAQNNQKPPVTPGDPRAVYIVVLNREKGEEPDFTKGGAKQLARWSNRVVVELPPAAIEAMLKHGRVKYVQHLITGTATAAAAPSTDGRVSASFVPKTMTGGGTLQWSTGDYHYDGSGNIDRIGADSDGKTRRFVYDEVDRLVEAGLEAPAAAPGTYTSYARYTYDTFGNRLLEQTPSMSQTLVADRNTNRVTLPGTVVTYDGVGNMTQGGGLMYQYDPFNNLKEVDSWSGVQKMSIYNADDERIIFCGDGSTGPCRWTLRGNGNEVLREYESGPIGNGNSFWSYYLWVEDSVYRGTLLAGAQRETAEGGRLHFHLDHLGTPRLTTNATGQKVTANELAPYGRELTSIMQEAQLGYDRTETHRFTGHERDFVEGTGSETVNFLDYMHARTYTAAFGRFLTVDPAMGEKESPQSWNRYAYARGNPVRNTDPDGRCTVDGERHNTLWCWMHAIGVTHTVHEQAEPIRQRMQTAIDHGGLIWRGGKVLNPKKMSDADVLATYDALVQQQRSEGAEGQFAKVAEIIVKTQWGWRGGTGYLEARRTINQPGDHKEINGKIPTESEARQLIEESGGKYLRTDPPHEAPNPHDYPHINYLTSSGQRAAVQIRPDV
jgi:RHS repeat-associated protein